MRRSFSRPSGPARNQYIWLGTTQLFHGLTLTFQPSDAGPFAAHSYMFSRTHSTFIVECGEATWSAAGFDRMNESETCRYLEGVFAEYLDGQPLLSNNFVKWLNFLMVSNARWRDDNVVAAGRRAAYGAFFDRLRHEARPRGCHRACQCVERRARRRNGAGAIRA